MYELTENIVTDSLFPHKINMRGALLEGGIFRLAKYLRTNNIDVIVACGAIYYPLACISGRLTGVKVVCWEHTNPAKRDDVAFEHIARRFGAVMSHRNVLISHAAYLYYCKHYRRKGNTLINNPADDSLFDSSTEYNLKSHTLLSVGRLTYAKNYQLLLDIANQILSNRDDWCWEIYGEGEDRTELEEKIASLGLKEKVILKGVVDDLYSRYPNYAAIVMTSRYEGFPMVLIEAAAKGLPMVSFDIETGPSEIITDDVNGFLVPANDAESMAKKLELLIEDPQMRMRMSEAARISVQPYKVKHICEQWRKLFEEMGFLR
jgi:glycosyltransferase involved in cell wall biosynthesis